MKVCYFHGVSARATHIVRAKDQVFTVCSKCAALFKDEVLVKIPERTTEEVARELCHVFFDGALFVQGKDATCFGQLVLELQDTLREDGGDGR